MTAGASRPRLSHLALLAVVSGAFLWSAVGPADRFTWALEVAPVVLILPILIATYARFRFSDLVYVLIAVHALILIVGGHYTYAEVPLGFWMERIFGFTRNHFDRIGHLAQGFVPAMIAREILVRRGVVTSRRWLAFLVVCICLAISASYELVEWAVADATGEAADAFLGTQGDPWDTQKDMLCALIGSLAALILLSHRHDRQIGSMTTVS
jgi:putative membrane protein